MAITVKHTKVSTIPDGDDSSLIRPSDWNDDHTLTGLGTMAEQDANSVAITGGTISGVTLPASNITGTLGVPNGGTGATTLTGYVKGTGTTAMTASATIPNTDITGLGTASTKDAGSPLGVATLDAGGKVPVSELPAAVLGALSYQGTWNASTNTPTLTSSTGTKGYYYVVSVAGNTNLDGITDWLVGDWAVYNGTVWQKVDNTETVTSVNGQTGAVTLTTTNIAEGTNLYYTDVRARASNSAGTGISYDSATGVITNSAPDQTVVLTGGTGISTSGTYPNFTITNSSPSLGGNVVGPASATDNAIARYDSTTGKLIQNSLVIIGDTGSVTGVNALTAESLVINNNATLGSSNTDTLEVLSRITTDLEPNANNSKDIGTSGRNWRDGFFGRNLDTVNLSVTGTTTFDGSQGTSGQVLTSAGTGATPTWTTPTTGTVTSVAATAGTGISVSGSPITSSGTLTITNTAPDQTVVLTGGTGISTSGTYPSFTVTNTAPDQTVAIASGTGISVSGTYPNFTVTNTAPSSGGTVTSVSGSAPIASSGGNTPTISITQANTSTNGFLSSTDWNTFNGKGTGTVTSVAALTLGTTGTDLSSTVANGTTTPVITLNVPTASAANRGALSAADWTTFNNKAAPFTYTTGYIPYGQGTTTPNQSASLTFASSTLTAPVVSASNGLVVNSNTVSASYSIPSGSSAMSAGPITVASGQTVTVPSGSRWVIL
jgi:hypothetical protein